MPRKIKKKKGKSIETEAEQIRLLKRLWSKKKASSKHRGISISLTYEQFVELSLSPCGYCGGEPSNLLVYGGLELPYNGIDRLNSQKAYDWDNCIPCCRFCNSLKGPMPDKYWLDFINDVVKLHSGQEPYPNLEGIDRNRKSYYKF